MRPRWSWSNPPRVVERHVPAVKASIDILKLTIWTGTTVSIATVAAPRAVSIAAKN
jgi:hypothetical protein